MSKQLEKKTKKRILKIKKKEYSEKLKEKINEYKDFDIERLLVIFENVLKTYNENNKNNSNSESFELELEALKNVIDKRSEDFTVKTKFNYYPDFHDKDFNEKILKKKEFQNFKIPEIKLKKSNGYFEIDDQCKNACQNNLEDEYMVLNPNQNFLRNFLSPDTPYNSLLLFHGTGVGKTCSSISIVEEYTDELKDNNKKIMILSNPSIKTNFIKNIFNINSVKKGKPLYQCTKDKYLKLVNISVKDAMKMDPQVLFSKIMRKINEKYSFFGYQEFANKIQKIIENKSYKEMKDKISKRFSNSVMIIDEAHNIKQGDDMKKVPPVLEKILKYSENMKLILLSATPMFDNSTEIVWLLNLLLMNDKRPLVSEKEIFKNGKLTVEGKELLLRKTRGYISYMRGENILKFPRRLYPSIYKDYKKILVHNNLPKLDIFGKEINTKLEILELIGCEFSGHQKKYYSKMSREKDFGSFLGNGLMASNIIFPSLEDDSISNVIGNNGFNNCFKKVKKGNIIKYKIKHEENMDMLKLENLKNYSCKITEIINNIKDSEGVIFIYSKYINSGILPLALALEYNGYTHYKKPLYEGETLDPVLVKGTSKQAKYMIISGTPELGKKAYDDYLKLENNNKNGEEIKIILGTETAAEGLDFKNIREVHILDPWYHLNKLEQIIGRAIRYCSHIELPLEKRNVVVNLYASVNNLVALPEDMETVDLNVYREAEIKSKNMSEVEYILKTGAIDCNLNLENNKQIGENYEGKMRIETPKNIKIDIDIKDLDNSRLCNYQKCDYKCIPNMPKISNDQIDFDTFMTDHLKEDQYILQKKISKLFYDEFIYSLDDIIEKIPDVENDVIYYTLQNMIVNKVNFKNIYSDTGHIIYRNKHYIFIPNYLDKQPVNVKEIRTPLTKKKKGINLTKYIENIKTVTEKPKFDIDMIVNNIKSNYYFLIREDSGRRELWIEARNSILEQYEKESFLDDDIDNSYNFIVNGQNFDDYEASLFNIEVCSYLGKTYKKKIYNYGFSSIALDMIETHMSNLYIKKAPVDGWKIKIDNFENFKNDLYENTKLYKTKNEKKLNKILLECECDWLPSPEKEALLQHLILNKDNLEGPKKKIYKILKTTNVLTNNDVYYKNPLYKDNNPDTIFGYKISSGKNIEYYKIVEEKFIKCSKDEVSLIKKSLVKKQQETKTNLISKLGYLEYKLPEKQVVLKIRDTLQQGKKGTQKRTGSICGSHGMKKGFISKFLDLFSDEYSKQELCILIELYLRINNNKIAPDKNINKRFFNVEETIESNLFKI